MLIKTVLKRLANKGFEIEVTSVNVEGTEIGWRARKPGKRYFVDVSRNGWNSDATPGYLYVNSDKGEASENQPDDYHAGFFCHTIKRALEIVETF